MRKSEGFSGTARRRSHTLDQITEFITAAQEANAVNVSALPPEYKNARFTAFAPMAEFTLEL